MFEGAARGLIHVNLATVSVALVKELAQLARQRGIAYVAAPVFGRPEVAEAAKLNVVVAGEAAAIARVEPLLQAIGRGSGRSARRPSVPTWSTSPVTS